MHLLPVAFIARRILSLRCLPRARPSLVLVIHGIDAWQPTRRRNVNRLARRIDTVIAVSEVTGRRFVAWSRVPWEKIVILPNCVDLTEFTPGPKSPRLQARYGLEDRTVIMTLGRLAFGGSYKGFDEVLEVLPDLLREFPLLAYLIVGDGSDRPRLIQKARSLGLNVRVSAPEGRDSHSVKVAKGSSVESSGGRASPRVLNVIETAVSDIPNVIFAGKISDAEKVEHYRLADTYVMPSRGEGFGIVYLEALACGVPVVASNVDGGREALREGKLGLLVNPANLEEIKAAIRASLQKERAFVQPGLDYFSSANFQRRTSTLIQTRMVQKLTPPRP
jgi:glycosyltransferase involved in cell wall biosynthesis